jgi:hypothetical protein
MRQVPAVYRRWFSEVAECTGQPSADTQWRFRRISWYTAKEIRERDAGSGATWGGWISPHTIIIREDNVESRVVVKHEMLHDLLPRVRNHESPFFLTCIEPRDIWRE